LSVLLLGCGASANIHGRVLRGMKNVTLSFASRDGARAESLCSRFGGRRSFGSYESGLADDSVDVVLVATPTATHHSLALAALDARRHVIVEKPAFMSVDEADAIRDAALAAGKQVMVAENYFYKPVAEYLRRVVASGALGEMRFVSLNATKRQKVAGWRGDPALSGGGALFEGGVHWISFASNIGLDVVSIEAIRAGGSAGRDRSSLVVIRYACGAVGTITHSWEIAAPLGHLRQSKVQGTKGAVTFESNGLARFTSGARRSLGIYALGDPFGYRAMLTDFLSAVRSDREPRFTLAMARHDLELLEQAEESMAQSGFSKTVRHESRHCSNASMSVR
jgi:predicted dehydrogenase